MVQPILRQLKIYGTEMVHFARLRSMKRITSPVPDDPNNRLRQLLQVLTDRIKGQLETLSRLVEAVSRQEFKAIPCAGSRGAFFFAGPTGVGKTYTAIILANEVCGPKRFVRFNCSEFKTLDAVARLLGDRAGDRGRFGQAYSRVKDGVWLFDEIEKAHPEFVHLFLQMTDAGQLTLANGETLDLSRIYIIVTSNLGSAEILGREHLPFTSLERRVVSCIQRYLRPELLARFGQPYVFRPLSREIQEEIAEQKMADLMLWQATQGRNITYDASVVRFIVQRGFSPRLGARPLLDTLHALVGNAIVENLRAGGNGSGVLVIDCNQLKLIS